MLQRMGIRFDANGIVDKASLSPSRRFTRGTKDRDDLKKEKLLQRVSKYVSLRTDNHEREAPDYLALAKQKIGVVQGPAAKPK